MTWTISIDWLDEHGVDQLEFEQALIDAGFDPFEIFDFDTQSWVFTADDADGDFIPDFLEGLISDPITTNPSQGGIFG